MNQYQSLLDSYLVFNDLLKICVSNQLCEIMEGDRTLSTGNNDLKRLLLKCTGAMTCEQIIRSFADNEEAYQACLNQVLSVIQDLLNRSVIFSETEPRFVSVKMETLEYLRPAVVSLELTNKCNLHCSYCYQECTPQNNTFLKNPMNLLESFKEMRVSGLEFTGGEPLLHPEIIQLLKYSVQNFQIIGLITNGTLISENILSILKKGTARTSLQICLDGPNAEIVDKIVGVRGSFNRIIKAIKMVKHHGLFLHVGMVLGNKESIKNIEETVKLVKDLGADSFTASPPLAWGRAKNTDFHEAKSEFIETHLRLQKEYSNFYLSETGIVPIEEYRTKGCGAGTRNISVNWNGSIKVCTLQPVEMFAFGNITDYRSNSIQDKLSKVSGLSTPGPENCGGCSHLSTCTGCLVRTLSLLLKNDVIRTKCNWYRQNSAILNDLQLC